MSNNRRELHENIIRLSEEELQELVDSVPDSRTVHNIQWTEAMDRVVLENYEKKDKSALAKALGISRTSLRARYLELKGREEER
jgi:hypothetical protein